MLRPLRKAFSLIDVAFLNSFLAIFIITSFVIDANLDYKESIRNTESELKVISNNLMAYWYKNHNLPCPSYSAKDIYSEQAISEARYLDDCLAFYGVTNSLNNEYYVGSIPIKDLNLDMEFLSDAWGGKYIYLVRKDIISSDNNYISKDYLNHQAKDLEWYSVAYENIEGSYWYADIKESGKIVNAEKNFNILDIGEDKYIQAEEIIINLDYLKSYILFDVKFAEELEFVISIDGVVLNLQYNDLKCKINIESFEGYNQSKEISCSNQNIFGFEYNAANNQLFFTMDLVRIFDIPINFSEFNLTLATINEAIMFENIIVFNAQDLSLILDYLERDTIPAYQDVVVNSSGESLEFSFLLLGNLRNQYASYNKAGRYLDHGHTKENLMKFEQGFFAKVIDFP